MSGKRPASTEQPWLARQLAALQDWLARELEALQDWLRRRRLWIGSALLAAGLVLLFTFHHAGRMYLAVEAQSDVMHVGLAQGRPLSWPMEQFSLIECRELIGDRAQRKPAQDATNAVRPLEEGTVVELNGIDPARHATNQAGSQGVGVTVAVDRGDVVVTIEAIDSKDNRAVSDPACTTTRSGAVLHNADGTSRLLQLPAQLRLSGTGIGEGLTFEYRGRVRIGTDVASGRQPLMATGTVVLKKVRSSWLQKLGASPSFDIDERRLTMGDKVLLAPPAQGQGSDVPEGFVRLRQTDTGPVMFVHAVSLAAQAELARPYSEIERPQATRLKALVRDEALRQWLTYWLSAVGLFWSVSRPRPTYSD